MRVAALCLWIAVFLAGLCLLMVWVFEYDPEFHVRTRVPAQVMASHAVLGMAGLELWVAFLLLSQPWGWIAVGSLAGAVMLGLVMAVRWLPARRAVPRDENFPLPLVAGHGVLAVATVALVLITV
jgi:multisubunit Na+/H+ antiporter MnhB subunit